MNKLINKLHDDFFDFPAISSMRPLLADEAGLFDRSKSMPSPDIVSAKDRVEINIPMAGYDKNDVDVFVEDGVLNVEAKGRSLYEDDVQFRSKGIYVDDFKWQLGLEHTLNAEELSATMNNGILSVRIPKKDKDRKKIRIDSGDS